MFRGSFRSGGGGGGGGALTVTTSTSADTPYDLPLSTQVLIVDTTTGVVNVNMPAASGSEGVIFYIKAKDNASTNRVRILVSSGLIDDDTFADINNDLAAVSLVSDGTNYFIL